MGLTATLISAEDKTDLAEDCLRLRICQMFILLCAFRHCSFESLWCRLF